MAPSIQGRSLVSLHDWTPQEIRYLLDLSHTLKKQRNAGERHRRLEGFSVALLFEKLSTRTRCAFETACGEEGGYPVFLSQKDIHLGVKETLEDTARVLGRMFDAIQFRGYSQTTVEVLARYSGKPVYNGLTDLYHPTQALADLMTLEETTGRLTGTKMVYLGDGRNNVARSLLIGCAKMGVDITVISPPDLSPDSQTYNLCLRYGESSGARIQATSDLAEVRNADAVYTDVWVSMGEDDKASQRVALLRPYQVSRDVMERTGKDSSIFLHCLPAVRENEVTSEVLDGAWSRAWDQAENRKHTIKAVMLSTLVQDRV
jgi:ornithine carbamoyltransferase